MIELAEEAVKIKKSSSNVNRFFSALSKYDDIGTLNYEMLHELIERIEVHEGIGTKKNKTYTVDVYFVGVGLIDLEKLE